MKAMLFIGNHPRHLYVAGELRKAGLLDSIVMEMREEFEPHPPAGLPEVDRANFVRHFRDRSESELRYFGDAGRYDFSDVPTLYVTREELNGARVQDWIRERKTEAAISFGVHILRGELLELLPAVRWNIHGGLSPWYRGNVTLFWPFYFLQPNWAGMTIHELTPVLDGGGVLHHSVPKLERGDGIHDVACKAVAAAARDVVKLLQMLKTGERLTAVPQRTSGKLFTSADWRPQHLRLIYNQFNNDIVDRYLDGELGHSAPPLVRAFEEE